MSHSDEPRAKKQAVELHQKPSGGGKGSGTAVQQQKTRVEWEDYLSPFAERWKGFALQSKRFEDHATFLSTIAGVSVGVVSEDGQLQPLASSTTSTSSTGGAPAIPPTLLYTSSTVYPMQSAVHPLFFVPGDVVAVDTNETDNRPTWDATKVTLLGFASEGTHAATAATNRRLSMELSLYFLHSMIQQPLGFPLVSSLLSHNEMAWKRLLLIRPPMSSGSSTQVPPMYVTFATRALDLLEKVLSTASALSFMRRSVELLLLQLSSSPFLVLCATVLVVNALPSKLWRLVEMCVAAVLSVPRIGSASACDNGLHSSALQGLCKILLRLQPLPDKLFALTANQLMAAAGTSRDLYTNFARLVPTPEDIKGTRLFMNPPSEITGTVGNQNTAAPAVGGSNLTIPPLNETPTVTTQALQELLFGPVVRAVRRHLAVQGEEHYPLSATKDFEKECHLAGVVGCPLSVDGILTGTLQQSTDPRNIAVSRALHLARATLGESATLQCMTVQYDAKNVDSKHYFEELSAQKADRMGFGSPPVLVAVRAGGQYWFFWLAVHHAMVLNTPSQSEEETPSGTVLLVASPLDANAGLLPALLESSKAEVEAIELAEGEGVDSVGLRQCVPEAVFVAHTPSSVLEGSTGGAEGNALHQSAVGLSALIDLHFRTAMDLPSRRSRTTGSTTSSSSGAAATTGGEHAQQRGDDEYVERFPFEQYIRKDGPLSCTPDAAPPPLIPPSEKQIFKRVLEQVNTAIARSSPTGTARLDPYQLTVVEGVCNSQLKLVDGVTGTGKSTCAAACSTALGSYNTQILATQLPTAMGCLQSLRKEMTLLISDTGKSPFHRHVQHRQQSLVGTFASTRDVSYEVGPLLDIDDSNTDEYFSKLLQSYNQQTQEMVRLGGLHDRKGPVLMTAANGSRARDRLGQSVAASGEKLGTPHPSSGRTVFSSSIDGIVAGATARATRAPVAQYLCSRIRTSTAQVRRMHCALRDPLSSLQLAAVKQWLHPTHANELAKEGAHAGSLFRSVFGLPAVRPTSLEANGEGQQHVNEQLSSFFAKEFSTAAKDSCVEYPLPPVFSTAGAGSGTTVAAFGAHSIYALSQEDKASYLDIVVSKAQEAANECLKNLLAARLATWHALLVDVIDAIVVADSRKVACVCASGADCLRYAELLEVFPFSALIVDDAHCFPSAALCALPTSIVTGAAKSLVLFRNDATSDISVERPSQRTVLRRVLPAIGKERSAIGTRLTVGRIHSQEIASVLQVLAPSSPKAAVTVENVAQATGLGMGQSLWTHTTRPAEAGVLPWGLSDCAESVLSVEMRMADHLYQRLAARGMPKGGSEEMEEQTASSGSCANSSFCVLVPNSVRGLARHIAHTKGLFSQKSSTGSGKGSSLASNMFIGTLDEIDDHFDIVVAVLGCLPPSGPPSTSTSTSSSTSSSTTTAAGQTSAAQPQTLVDINWLYRTVSRSRQGFVVIGHPNVVRHVPFLRLFADWAHPAQRRTAGEETAWQATAKERGDWLAGLVQWPTSEDASYVRPYLLMQCPRHPKTEWLSIVEDPKPTTTGTTAGDDKETKSSHPSKEEESRVEELKEGDCQRICLQSFSNCTDSKHRCFRSCHGITPSVNHNQCPFFCGKVLPCGHMCQEPCGERCKCNAKQWLELPCGQPIVSGFERGAVTYKTFPHFQEGSCGDAALPCTITTIKTCPCCRRLFKAPCSEPMGEHCPHCRVLANKLMEAAKATNMTPMVEAQLKQQQEQVMEKQLLLEKKLALEIAKDGPMKHPLYQQESKRVDTARQNQEEQKKALEEVIEKQQIDCIAAARKSLQTEKHLTEGQVLFRRFLTERVQAAVSRQVSRSQHAAEYE